MVTRTGKRREKKTATRKGEDPRRKNKVDVIRTAKNWWERDGEKKNKPTTWRMEGAEWTVPCRNKIDRFSNKNWMWEQVRLYYVRE